MEIVVNRAVRHEGNTCFAGEKVEVTDDHVKEFVDGDLIDYEATTTEALYSIVQALEIKGRSKIKGDKSKMIEAITEKS